ncbi:hypothetical protein [Clostridium chrysemydis]|uniref:hypothetical protein n=1 Tax=Clostridium chrysemydis TaxID=2665504 RepID=UPI0018832FBA|nr:hypothetical protein [Clostridium chrysemydis]
MKKINEVLGNIKVDNEGLTLEFLETVKGQEFKGLIEETGEISVGKFEDLFAECFELNVENAKECLQTFIIWGGDLVEVEDSICIYDRQEDTTLILY